MQFESGGLEGATGLTWAGAEALMSVSHHPRIYHAENWGDVPLCPNLPLPCILRQTTFHRGHHQLCLVDVDSQSWLEEQMNK